MIVVQVTNLAALDLFMTIEETIQMFERLENKAEIPIDLNLHNGINYVMKGDYTTYHNKEGTFSSFLKSLAKMEYPK